VSALDQIALLAGFRQKVSNDVLVARGGLALLAAFLTIAIALPLYSVFSRSVRDNEGVFVGMRNFGRFLSEPGLAVSVWNSLLVAIISTFLTVSLAFFYAYALNRSLMPGKWIFRGIAMTPLLAPSLLPAIALIYLFGKQGVINGVLLGHSIYGPLGIVVGEVLFSFPHALLIITIALSTTDQRLYDAATSLRAGPLRIFLTVTLPACRYGLLSAFFAVFTLVFTDFGVPSVIGGSYPVLATELYKQVIGRFDFPMGAVAGIFLLVPAIIAFIADRIVQRRETAMISTSAVPLQLKPNGVRDVVCFLFCATVALTLLGILATAAFGSFIKFWPYDLSLSLRNYDFRGVDSTGWYVYINSLKLAGWTAFLGTPIIFLGAYFIEKGRGFGWFRAFAQLLCMVPLAVPGMVLGLSYIFFFNNPANPLNFVYGTMSILVLSTIAHFYTVPHLAAITALKQLDREFESVGESLKVPFWVTLRRVTIPACLPAILDIWTYLFVNSMTTVSAVIFLYVASTKLSSVTIVNWADWGKLPAASAMGMMIFATSSGVWFLQVVISRRLLRRTQAWRER